jgi:hypothetical protein
MKRQPENGIPPSRSVTLLSLKNQNDSSYHEGGEDGFDEHSGNNPTPQKGEYPLVDDDGELEQMTEEDLKYIRHMQEQLMGMQSLEGFDDSDIQAKLLNMLKSQSQESQNSEEDRINRILRFMDPRDAAVVAENLKTMNSEERSHFIQQFEM